VIVGTDGTCKPVSDLPQAVVIKFVKPGTRHTTKANNRSSGTFQQDKVIRTDAIVRSALHKRKPGLNGFSALKNEGQEWLSKNC
jgi:hypothetical protein